MKGKNKPMQERVIVQVARACAKDRKKSGLNDQDKGVKKI